MRTFVYRWREEFGVRDIKEEDIEDEDKKVQKLVPKSATRWRVVCPPRDRKGY